MRLNKKSIAIRNPVRNTIANNILFQTIAIGWFFGVNKFAGCVEQMTGFK
jgi:hypothetical protein